MKLFKSFMLVGVLSFSFFLSNTSAEAFDVEEVDESNPFVFDRLSEASEDEAKELEQKVLEDMKNNPDKVEYAVPTDGKFDFFENRAVVLPYSYDFKYYTSLKGRNFWDLTGYTTLNNRMNVRNSASVTYSLYTKSGKFVASRIYPGNKMSTAKIKTQHGQEYYFILTGSKGWKEGNGYTWMTLY